MLCEIEKNRITAVMKVETDIIIYILASPIQQAVIMYVKTDVIVFFSNIIICLRLQSQIIFSIKASLLILTRSHYEIKGEMSKFY
jgi:hypothetical protein